MQLWCTALPPQLPSLLGHCLLHFCQPYWGASVAQKQVWYTALPPQVPSLFGHPTGAGPSEDPEPPTTEQQRATRYIQTGADPTYNPILREWPLLVVAFKAAGPSSEPCLLGICIRESLCSLSINTGASIS